MSVAGHRIQDQEGARVTAALLDTAVCDEPELGAAGQVRRGPNLVNDTLIQIQNAGAQGALKHPLRVQFAGEEGVDEGGVQKVSALPPRAALAAGIGQCTRHSGACQRVAGTPVCAAAPG